MFTRRQFLQATAGVGTGLFLPLLAGRAYGQTMPLLDPLTQPKFLNPLPNVLAPAYHYQATGMDKKSKMQTFDVRIEQFTHDAGLVDPATGRALQTTVWGYGTPTQAPVFPGYTFEVRQGQGIKVRYANGLDGKSYPADVPVDATLHWADPLAQGEVAGPYLGPVPVVPHQHGGDTESLSDGLPDAWFTPDNGITGRLFNPVYTYDNRQEATQLWYHDHPVGITRLNVYMGLAGNYFIRDANEDALGLPRYPYEAPLLIQDRQFLANGELFYPSVDPAVSFAPTHMPEMFGDVILVNGKAWPVLDVEPRKYRFRVLNGSDSRVYDMHLSNGHPIVQIGSDLGLLNAPVAQAVLSVAPGERADVIIDFAGQSGQTIIIRNTAKAPYPSGDVTDPQTAGQIMAFRVVLPRNDRVVENPIPANLRPMSGPVAVYANPVRTRRILLFEGTDKFGRLQTMAGIVDPTRPALDGTLTFEQPITENPQVGDTEIWEFYNTTADAHPLHMHLVDFRILNRQKFRGTILPKTNPDGSQGGVLVADSVEMLGNPKIPGAEERGLKDTAKMFPGEVTRIIARFSRPGEYVYHCHILSHEDHEMMRPYFVGACPGGRCA